jgi:uncharacterized protein
MPTQPALPNEQADSRPIAAAAAVTVARLTLDLYQLILAPFLSAQSGWSCRFEPTCSRYARIALLRHGIWRGGYLTLRRLARCHPWGSCGFDPVPQIKRLQSSNQ